MTPPAEGRLGNGQPEPGQLGPGQLGPGQLGLGQLATESVRPELDGLDLLAAPDLVQLMAADSRRATEAVLAATPAITAAVELVYRKLTEGGRLIYLGAGTAGRLAVLDAAELGPTFSVPEGIVVAVMAGGDHALRHAVEGAEDDRAAGATVVVGLNVGCHDVVIGVSASGRTPYVLGAIDCARSRGAATIGLACNWATPLAAAAELAIEVVVGGEVVAGSSRMNAGTAQKITLNTISTAAMVMLGKTYGNLMVDVRATNTKLRDRAVRIVEAVTGASAQRASEALEMAGWNTKLASLVAASGTDVSSAVSALETANGRLREALTLVSRGSARSSRPPTTWRRLGVAAALVDGRLVPGDVAVHDGLVVAVGLPGPGTGFAAPGLVDLQVNGYAGVDAERSSTDELEWMCAALARDGVLAYQPTLISGEPAVTAAATKRITEVARRQGSLRSARLGARILGTHLEGPFLAPSRAGTHPVERLHRPDPELAEMLLSAGHVTMVTLAPELPGAVELIHQLRRRGVVVSLGHSAATAADAATAVRAGASVVTHLFNAMSPLAARAPGLAGFALSDQRVRVQLIADGGHVSDELVRLAFAAAGPRCSLVTDATSLSGGGDHQLLLGEVPISLSNGLARRPDGTIAGGASRLVDALRRLGALPLGPADALAAVTERPAQVLGRRDIGYLQPGGPADLVVLDDAFGLRDVLIGGQLVDRG